MHQELFEASEAVEGTISNFSEVYQFFNKRLTPYFTYRLMVSILHLV